MSGKAVDETGHQYGVYTVIGRACLPRQKAYWKCRCICGKIDIIAGGNLRAGSYHKKCRHGSSYVDEANIKDTKPDEIWRERYAKYGCYDCLEKGQCKINEPCKYERVFKKYRNYREYIENTDLGFFGRGVK